MRAELSTSKLPVSGLKLSLLRKNIYLFRISPLSVSSFFSRGNQEIWGSVGWRGWEVCWGDVIIE